MANLLGQASSGWKMNDKDWRMYLASISIEGEVSEEVLASWTKGAPSLVTTTDWFGDDVKAIWRLFLAGTPQFSRG